MKKQASTKKTKKASKKSVAHSEPPPLPGLVEAMAKLVERLEVLERKTDQVIGRVSNLPSDIRQLIQNRDRLDQIPIRMSVPEGKKERIMYQTICADCRKNCEVPFKPTADRPVYCKECFAIRKAGHVPTDPSQRLAPANPQKKIFTPEPMDYNPEQKSNPRSQSLAGTKQKSKVKKKKISNFK